jgi:uncharacterized tellurite resistance protein B-like protein
MRAVALAGVSVLSADRDISEHEIKILVEILHHYFTDEPEREIPANGADLEPRLAAAIAEVNQLGEERHKTFILSRLADIALADGALMDKEGARILEIAQALEVPPKAAYGILVGAAQAVGFKVDVKLNRVAAELRRSLGVGLAPRLTRKPGH